MRSVSQSSGVSMVERVPWYEVVSDDTNEVMSKGAERRERCVNDDVVRASATNDDTRTQQ